MNVKIQSVKFDADKKLIEFVENKVGKLDKFSSHITHCEVTLKLDKNDELGNKVAVLILELPGDNLVAEQRSKSFEESVDLAIEALKKQLDKYKEKHA